MFDPLTAVHEEILKLTLSDLVGGINAILTSRMAIPLCQITQWTDSSRYLPHEKLAAPGVAKGQA